MKPFEQLVLLLIASPLITATMESLNDYINKWPGVDESALAMCWIMNGQISEVEAGNPVKGFLCSMNINIWTHDDKHAEEYCHSRFPFPIVGASSDNTGGDAYTKCTFQINLFCDKSWTQIHNRCYKIVPHTKYTYEEAKSTCVKFMPDPKWKAGVALYYSDALEIAFADMDLESVWVTIPDIKERFRNGEGEAAVFVQDSAFKYDTKPGTLILPEGDEKHQALCEYTPMMTKAEMYYMAEIYKEIYPIHVTSSGASITSSSYVTVTQLKGTKNTFNVDEIKATCAAIGNILNVNSYPLISILEEWQDAKAGLDKHRFYLTAAYKNEGCSRKAYMDWDENGKDVQVYQGTKFNDKDYCDAHSFVFSQIENSDGEGRYPTPAAFRAPVLCSLHSYGFEYGNCPAGWIPYKRALGVVFCHFIEHVKYVPVETAKDECNKLGATLGGFDSVEEFNFIRNKITTSYEPDRNTPAATHFLLSASSPCKNNCHDPDTGKTWLVGWDEGVSRDTKFLNTVRSYWRGNPYLEDRYYQPAAEHISFRDDMDGFHDHPTEDFPMHHYICGKFAGMIAKRNEGWTLRNN